MKKALVTLILSLFGITALSAKCGINNPPKPCYIGGCSSQLCTDEPNAISTCEWRAEYACYADATCERQANGECGWAETSELQECLENPPPIDPAPEQCYVGGCSRQLCTDDPNAISTCEWTAAYACYADATCERQVGGECGWKKTSELQACLANPPNEDLVVPPAN